MVAVVACAKLKSEGQVVARSFAVQRFPVQDGTTTTTTTTTATATATAMQQMYIIIHIFFLNEGCVRQKVLPMTWRHACKLQIAL